MKVLVAACVLIYAILIGVCIDGIKDIFAKLRDIEHRITFIQGEIDGLIHRLNKNKT